MVTESDIRGGNTYKSAFGSKWASILVRTGVFRGEDPSYKPKVIVDDVYDAVQWATDDAKKP
jgi:ribonucleotide monophosphatase NagD (HAD superfamily)